MNTRLTSALSLVALLAFGRDALAADPPCDMAATDYKCTIANSGMQATMKKSLTQIPFDNKLNSGWVGCGGTASTCTGQPTGSCTISACIEAAMSDSKIDVSMQSYFDVSWPDPGKLRITPRKKVNTGSFGVSYRLTPLIGIYVNAFGFKSTVVMNPTDIIAALGAPGIEAGFAAPASCQSAFDPFAFAPTPAMCHATGFDEVFQIPLSKLTGLVGLDPSQYIEMDVAIAAGTDTTFTWTTTDIDIEKGDKKVTPTQTYSVVNYAGEDSLQLNVWGVGKLGYVGTTELKPEILVNSVLGFNFSSPLKLSVSVGAKVPYMGEVPGIQLSKTTIDIPLPNLFVPTTPLDFGEIDVGTTAAKTVKMTNTGKLLVKSSVSSSEPAYKLEKQKIDVNPDGGTSDLKVTFFPTKPGVFQGKITVASNDVDEPVLEIPVTGKAKGEPLPMGEGGMGGAAGAAGKAGAAGAAPAAGSGGAAPTAGAAGKAGGSLDDQAADEEIVQKGGCGCRVADERERSAGVVLAGLAGLAVMLRRRRSR